ncbi:MAG TPA: tetratricopeptide repeat protein [Rhodanobacteraceae bacterium]
MATRLMRHVRLGVLLCALAALLAGCATSPTARLSDLAAVQQQADSAYSRHDWRTAAAAYEALTQRVPGNAAYWFRLGNCYARLDRPEPAVAAYRAALQRDPHIAPAWHNLGAVLLEQSQAAFQQSAANAKPGDPLKRASALLTARVGVVRQGMSGAIPAQGQPATVRSVAAPATASSAPGPQGGAR